MIKADQYFSETVREIINTGFDSVNPRTKWADGTPAHYKYILPKVFTYDIAKGEFPINTFRPTALKGAYHDIEAIYQKQTNLVDEMDKSIHSWWKDFIVDDQGSLGQTYGHTVQRYNLMSNLLKSLIRDPFGRRNMLDLWQVQQMHDDPKALVPCCFLSMYTVTETPCSEVSIQNINFKRRAAKKRQLHLTLVQRSMDCMMTFSINPIQYTMLGMMICSHLNFAANANADYYYEMGTLTHFVQNPHIYDRHFPGAEELLSRKATGEQAILRLNSNAKNFYNISWEDFTVENYLKPKPLKEKLEIAI